MILQILFLFYLSIIIHECSHGWVAYRCGDPTAKQAGRLTLNPFNHIDPVGTIIVPLLLKITHFPVIVGWPKAVPVNFRGLRSPKRDMILVAFAGPAANFLLAIVLGLLVHISRIDYIKEVLSVGIMINLMLGTFNLLPIPPLDGYRIVIGMLPDKIFSRYSHNYSIARLEPLGIVLVIILSYFGLLDFIWPVVEFFAKHSGVDLSSLGM